MYNNIKRGVTMKTCLVTAFEPFGNQMVNASKETLDRLPDTIKDYQIIKQVLPVVFHASFEMIKKTIINQSPDLIIMLGEAGGRRQVEIERIAINIDDARIKDNNGYQPIDKKIIANGPDAYLTKLPYRNIMTYVAHKDLNIGLSNSAGTYVCNHLMYQVLHFIHSHEPFKRIPTGFIHVPYTTKQASSIEIPSMDSNDIAHTICVVIESFN
jgi:pyroglutamyl-peptidase